MCVRERVCVCERECVCLRASVCESMCVEESVRVGVRVFCLNIIKQNRQEAQTIREKWRS